MNEKRIREVIDVEKRALELVAQAHREAEQIPIKAEAEATAIIEKARAAAQEEARHILEQAQNGDDAAAILKRAQEDMSKSASLADLNREKAVALVVERILGGA